MAKGARTCENSAQILRLDFIHDRRSLGMIMAGSASQNPTELPYNIGCWSITSKTRVFVKHGMNGSPVGISDREIFLFRGRAVHHLKGSGGQRTGMWAAVWPRSASVAQKTVKMRVAVRMVSSSQMDACTVASGSQPCTVHARALSFAARPDPVRADTPPQCPWRSVQETGSESARRSVPGPGRWCRPSSPPSQHGPSASTSAGQLIKTPERCRLQRGSSKLSRCGRRRCCAYAVVADACGRSSGR